MSKIKVEFYHQKFWPKVVSECPDVNYFMVVSSPDRFVADIFVIKPFRALAFFPMIISNDFHIQVYKWYSLVCT